MTLQAAVKSGFTSKPWSTITKMSSTNNRGKRTETVICLTTASNEAGFPLAVLVALCNSLTDPLCFNVVSPSGRCQSSPSECLKLLLQPMRSSYSVSQSAARVINQQLCVCVCVLVLVLTVRLLMLSDRASICNAAPSVIAICNTHTHTAITCHDYTVHALKPRSFLSFRTEIRKCLH